MKLEDLQSKDLLPRFAHDFEWIQLAFDLVVKRVHARTKSIDAPLTLEAIHALTDEELQEIYNEYGIAQYYPDLSRETRDQMLFELCRYYRFLGTPKAIEILCNYILNGIPLDVEVYDNLAFDEQGELIDQSLLDVFDIKVGPQVPLLSADANERILANVNRFSRNSQTLRYIYYDFESGTDINVSVGLDPDNPQVVVEYPDNGMCEPVIIRIPMGGTISTTSDNVIYTQDSGGLVVPGSYAYQDGDLLDMQWDFGGTVEEYSPVISLPTVSFINGAVGTLSQQGTQASVADGDSVYSYSYVTNTYQLSTIGAGNIICASRITNDTATITQAAIGWDAERTSDGYIKITNNSGTTFTNLYSCLLYYCDNQSVQITVVYRLSDGVAFNAFKCNFQESNYYYVLDWSLTSKDWTNDLNRIGYSLYPFESLNEIAFNSVTLPETHLGAYVGTVFDSLRYYAQVTISNTGTYSGKKVGVNSTWYYGTVTWEDPSLGDLTDKIAITDIDDENATLIQQNVFRIIFIKLEHISGIHPSDTSESTHNFISAYSYNNGVHSMEFYAHSDQWYTYSYQGSNGRIQLRYLDGTTTFKGLSGFDLFDADSFHVLTKSTTTDRYDMYSVWNGSVKVYALYSNFIYVPVFRAYLSTSGAASPGNSVIVSHGNSPLYDKRGVSIPLEDKYYKLLRMAMYNGDNVPLGGLYLWNDGTNVVLRNDNYGYINAYVLEYLCIPAQLVNQTIKAYKSDGTVSDCELDNNGYYRIASFDNNAWHTESELNNGGWYIRWRIYSTSNSGGINIRDNGSVIGTNTIGRYYPSQHLIGNPFLIQVDPNDSTYTMQKILFTEDNGSTVQTGWCVCVGNSSVSFTLGFVDSDVAFLSNY